MQGAADAHEDQAHRDLLHRVRRLRPRDHRRRRAGLGPGVDLQRRHHRPDPAPAGGAVGAGRRTRSTSTRWSTASPSASTSSPARTCTARSAASTPRCGTCAASSKASRVCELLGGTPGPLRAYASSMKRDITPAHEAARFARPARALRLRRLQVPHRRRIRPRRRRMAGPHRGHRAGDAPCARRRRGAAGRCQQLLLAAARDRGRRSCCRTTASAISRSPAPTGSSSRRRQVRDALALDVTGGEQDNYLPRVAPHDRDEGGRHRAARRLLPRRHRPHAARGAHGATPPDCPARRTAPICRW